MAIIVPFGGKYPTIEKDVFLAENACIIGDVRIGSGSSVWFGCVLRGDINPIIVKQNTNIQDNTVVHVDSGKDGYVEIGSNVTIGHSAIIHACRIMDCAFIGMGSLIMDYATVEKYAMIAAGSLVSKNKSVKERELWVGRPAKPMRRVSDEEVRLIDQSAVEYYKLSQAYNIDPEK